MRRLLDLLTEQLVNSCLVPVLQAEGAEIRRSKASRGEQFMRVQQAFIDCGGAQCGICTPGMVLAAVTLARAQSASGRRRDSRRTCRQSLPLHRLQEDFRICFAGVSTIGRSRHMRSYVPAYELRVAAESG